MEGGGIGQGEGQRPTVLFSPNALWEKALGEKTLGKKPLAGRPLGCTPVFSDFDAPGLSPGEHDFIVPLSLDWARWLNGPRGEAFRHKALVPSDRAMALCDDKLAFNRYLMSKGLAAHVPLIGRKLDYPYVVKPRSGIWGNDTHVICGPDDEARHADALAGDTSFCQQFIAGPCEYATHMLVAGRQIVFVRTLEYRFGTDRYIHGRNKPPIARAWVDHRAYYGLFALILGWLGYRGFCCINYKLVGGVVKIFEINPRPGASLRFAASYALAAYRAAVLAQQPHHTA